MKMIVSRIFDLLTKCTGRIRVLEGGSRSSKTWSIIQFLIIYCQTAASKNQVKRITISRQKLTWLKATVLIDFIEILKLYEIWNENDYHKSDMTYALFGCEISFIGLDEPQKLHGRKQNVFWINEAIEATFDDFTQMLMRTTEFCLLDYNPSLTEHWIFDKVLQRPDADFIHSTMLDNPFLEESIRQEIMSYEPTEINIARGTADENKWKIYGKGERAQIEGLVFPDVNYVESLPAFSKTGIGLDFGFTNDPTAIVRIGLNSGELFCKELLYERRLTNDDISRELARLGISSNELIVADSAEQKSIEELRRMGWNIAGAIKGDGSVNLGISSIKKYKINITSDSLNFKKEQQNYTWRKDRSTNSFTNTPIDNHNHLWDATRYIASELLPFNQEFNGLPPRAIGRHWTQAL